MGKKVKVTATVTMEIDEKWEDVAVERAIIGSLETWLKAKNIEVKVSR